MGSPPPQALLRAAATRHILFSTSSNASDAREWDGDLPSRERGRLAGWGEHPDGRFRRFSARSDRHPAPISSVAMHTLQLSEEPASQIVPAMWEHRTRGGLHDVETRSEERRV